MTHVGLVERLEKLLLVARVASFFVVALLFVVLALIGRFSLPIIVHTHEPAPDELTEIIIVESSREAVPMIASAQPQVPIAPSVPRAQPAQRSISKAPRQIQDPNVTPAKVTAQVLPSIPQHLRAAQFHSYVRVSVTIRQSGSAEVVLTESSGNTTIDRCVLDALQQWRWSPAQKNGVPIDSVKNFKFEFEVR